MRDTQQGSRDTASAAITAPSRTESLSSSTWTSPWPWAESGPGPRHQGSRPDGSRPEAAACSNQDGPGGKREVDERKEEEEEEKLILTCKLKYLSLTRNKQ